MVSRSLSEDAKRYWRPVIRAYLWDENSRMARIFGPKREFRTGLIFGLAESVTIGRSGSEWR